jgi:hypothetical protein
VEVVEGANHRLEIDGDIEATLDLLSDYVAGMRRFLHAG